MCMSGTARRVAVGRGLTVFLQGARVENERELFTGLVQTYVHSMQAANLVAWSPVGKLRLCRALLHF